ncbi:MAG: LysM peptidoglycan-binding domain-containing protein [Spirochaetes bacterium]|jgi:nucleoid-associated protein YgaU|nr:LysM peptidoglycan-binding domain-containing protein [Spirochaetota bacterium]
MKFRKSNTISIFLAAILVCLGCNDKIPIKEMALARYEISQAIAVKAEKYAPDELNEAKKKLMESHDLVKTDKLEDSQKAADSSLKKAEEAYNKALPLLAKDTIDAAEKSIESADEAYAKVLAEEEFTKAGISQVKANELFEQKKYHPSYEGALEADAQAIEARNIAISKKSILAEAIAEVKTTLEDANKFNAPKYAPEKFTGAGENVKTSEAALEGLLLKKGFAAIEIAKMEADEAYQKSLDGTAKDKSEEAKTLFPQAEASEGASIAKDELNGAKEAMLLAESLLSESKFKDSISASDESIRLLTIVLNTKKPVEVAVADKDANAAAEKDKDKNVKTGTDADKTGVKTTEEEEVDYILYKVRYIPDRRDCLWRISGKFYTNPRKWKEIYNENKEKINNPDLIWPNMMLKIPKVKKSKINQEGVVNKETGK